MASWFTALKKEVEQPHSAQSVNELLWNVDDYTTDEYTRTGTRRKAKELFRIFQRTPRSVRRNPAFIIHARMQLSLLRLYNNGVFMQKNRYPRTRWMFYLLCRYVALEYESLGQNPDPNKCEAEKLILVLENILSKYFDVDSEIRCKVFMVHIIVTAFHTYKIPEWYRELLTGLALKGTVIQKQLDELYSGDDDLLYVGNFWFNEELKYFMEVDDFGTDDEASDLSDVEDSTNFVKSRHRRKNNNTTKPTAYLMKRDLDDDDVIIIKDEKDTSDCDPTRVFDDTIRKTSKNQQQTQPQNGAIKKTTNSSSSSSSGKKTSEVIVIDDDEEEESKGSKSVDSDVELVDCGVAFFPKANKKKSRRRKTSFEGKKTPKPICIDDDDDVVFEEKEKVLLKEKPSASKSTKNFGLDENDDFLRQLQELAPTTNSPTKLRNERKPKLQEPNQSIDVNNEHKLKLHESIDVNNKHKIKVQKPNRSMVVNNEDNLKLHEPNQTIDVNNKDNLKLREQNQPIDVNNEQHREIAPPIKADKQNLKVDEINSPSGKHNLNVQALDQQIRAIEERNLDVQTLDRNIGVVDKRKLNVQTLDRQIGASDEHNLNVQALDQQIRAIEEPNLDVRTLDRHIGVVDERNLHVQTLDRQIGVIDEHNLNVQALDQQIEEHNLDIRTSDRQIGVVDDCNLHVQTLDQQIGVIDQHNLNVQALDQQIVIDERNPDVQTLNRQIGVIDKHNLNEQKLNPPIGAISGPNLNVEELTSTDSLGTINPSPHDENKEKPSDLNQRGNETEVSTENTSMRKEIIPGRIRIKRFSTISVKHGLSIDDCNCTPQNKPTEVNRHDPTPLNRSSPVDNQNIPTPLCKSSEEIDKHNLVLHNEPSDAINEQNLTSMSRSSIAVHNLNKENLTSMSRSSIAVLNLNEQNLTSISRSSIAVHNLNDQNLTSMSRSSIAVHNLNEDNLASKNKSSIAVHNLNDMIDKQNLTSKNSSSIPVHNLDDLSKEHSLPAKKDENNTPSTKPCPAYSEVSSTQIISDDEENAEEKEEKSADLTSKANKSLVSNVQETSSSLSKEGNIFYSTRDSLDSGLQSNKKLVSNAKEAEFLSSTKTAEDSINAERDVSKSAGVSKPNKDHSIKSSDSIVISSFPSWTEKLLGTKKDVLSSKNYSLKKVEGTVNIGNVSNARFQKTVRFSKDTIAQNIRSDKTLDTANIGNVSNARFQKTGQFSKDTLAQNIPSDKTLDTHLLENKEKVFHTQISSKDFLRNMLTDEECSSSKNTQTSSRDFIRGMLTDEECSSSNDFLSTNKGDATTSILVGKSENALLDTCINEDIEAIRLKFQRTQLETYVGKNTSKDKKPNLSLKKAALNIINVIKNKRNDKHNFTPALHTSDSKMDSLDKYKASIQRTTFTDLEENEATYDHRIMFDASVIKAGVLDMALNKITNRVVDKFVPHDVVVEKTLNPELDDKTTALDSTEGRGNNTTQGNVKESFLNQDEVRKALDSDTTQETSHGVLIKNTTGTAQSFKMLDIPSETNQGALIENIADTIEEKDHCELVTSLRVLDAAPENNQGADPAQENSEVILIKESGLSDTTQENDQDVFNTNSTTLDTVQESQLLKTSFATLQESQLVDASFNTNSTTLDTVQESQLLKTSFTTVQESQLVDTSLATVQESQLVETSLDTNAKDFDINTRSVLDIPEGEPSQRQTFQTSLLDSLPHTAAESVNGKSSLDLDGRKVQDILVNSEVVESEEIPQVEIVNKKSLMDIDGQKLEGDGASEETPRVEVSVTNIGQSETVNRKALVDIHGEKLGDISVDDEVTGSEETPQVEVSATNVGQLNKKASLGIDRQKLEDRSVDGEVTGSEETPLVEVAVTNVGQSEIVNRETLLDIDRQKLEDTSVDGKVTGSEETHQIEVAGTNVGHSETVNRKTLVDMNSITEYGQKLADISVDGEVARSRVEAAVINIGQPLDSDNSHPTVAENLNSDVHSKVGTQSEEFLEIRNEKEGLLDYSADLFDETLNKTETSTGAGGIDQSKCSHNYVNSNVTVESVRQSKEIDQSNFTLENINSNFTVESVGQSKEIDQSNLTLENINSNFTMESVGQSKEIDQSNFTLENINSNVTVESVGQLDTEVEGRDNNAFEKASPPCEGTSSVCEEEINVICYKEQQQKDITETSVTCEENPQDPEETNSVQQQKIPQQEEIISSTTLETNSSTPCGAETVVTSQAVDFEMVPSEHVNFEEITIPKSGLRTENEVEECNFQENKIVTIDENQTGLESTPDLTLEDEAIPQPTFDTVTSEEVESGENQMSVDSKNVAELQLVEESNFDNSALEGVEITKSNSVHDSSYFEENAASGVNKGGVDSTLFVEIIPESLQKATIQEGEEAVEHHEGLGSNFEETRNTEGAVNRLSVDPQQNIAEEMHVADRDVVVHTSSSEEISYERCDVIEGNQVGLNEPILPWNRDPNQSVDPNHYGEDLRVINQIDLVVHTEEDQVDFVETPCLLDDQVVLENVVETSGLKDNQVDMTNSVETSCLEDNSVVMTSAVESSCLEDNQVVMTNVETPCSEDNQVVITNVETNEVETSCLEDNSVGMTSVVETSCLEDNQVVTKDVVETSYLQNNQVGMINVEINELKTSCLEDNSVVVTSVVETSCLEDNQVVVETSCLENNQVGMTNVEINEVETSCLEDNSVVITSVVETSCLEDNQVVVETSCLENNQVGMTNVETNAVKTSCLDDNSVVVTSIVESSSLEDTQVVMTNVETNAVSKNKVDSSLKQVGLTLTHPLEENQEVTNQAVNLSISVSGGDSMGGEDNYLTNRTIIDKISSHEETNQVAIVEMGSLEVIQAGNQVGSIDTSNYETNQVDNVETSNYETNQVNSVETSNYETNQVGSVETSNYETNQVGSVETSNYETNQVNSVETSNYETNQVGSVETSNYETNQVGSVETSNYETNQVGSLVTCNYETNQVTSFRDTNEAEYQVGVDQTSGFIAFNQTGVEEVDSQALNQAGVEEVKCEEIPINHEKPSFEVINEVCIEAEPSNFEVINEVCVGTDLIVQSTPNSLIDPEMPHLEVASEVCVDTANQAEDLISPNLNPIINREGVDSHVGFTYTPESEVNLTHNDESAREVLEHNMGIFSVAVEKIIQENKSREGIDATTPKRRGRKKGRVLPVRDVVQRKPITRSSSKSQKLQQNEEKADASEEANIRQTRSKNAKKKINERAKKAAEVVMNKEVENLKSDDVGKKGRRHLKFEVASDDSFDGLKVNDGNEGKKGKRSLKFEVDEGSDGKSLKAEVVSPNDESLKDKKIGKSGRKGKHSKVNKNSSKLAGDAKGDVRPRGVSQDSEPQSDPNESHRKGKCAVNKNRKGSTTEDTVVPPKTADVTLSYKKTKSTASESYVKKGAVNKNLKLIESMDSNDDSSDSCEGKLVISDETPVVSPRKKTVSRKEERDRIKIKTKKMCEMEIQAEPVPTLDEVVKQTTTCKDVSKLLDDATKDSDYNLDYKLLNEAKLIDDAKNTNCKLIDDAKDYNLIDERKESIHHSDYNSIDERKEFINPSDYNLIDEAKEPKHHNEYSPRSLRLKTKAQLKSYNKINEADLFVPNVSKSNKTEEKAGEVNVEVSLQKALTDAKIFIKTIEDEDRGAELNCAPLHVNEEIVYAESHDTTKEDLIPQSTDQALDYSQPHLRSLIEYSSMSEDLKNTTNELQNFGVNKNTVKNKNEAEEYSPSQSLIRVSTGQDCGTSLNKQNVGEFLKIAPSVGQKTAKPLKCSAGDDPINSSPYSISNLLKIDESAGKTSRNVWLTAPTGDTDNVTTSLGVALAVSKDVDQAKLSSLTIDVSDEITSSTRETFDVRLDSPQINKDLIATGTVPYESTSSDERLGSSRMNKGLIAEGKIPNESTSSDMRLGSPQIDKDVIVLGEIPSETTISDVRLGPPQIDKDLIVPEKIPNETIISDVRLGPPQIDKDVIVPGKIPNETTISDVRLDPPQIDKDLIVPGETPNETTNSGDCRKSSSEDKSKVILLGNVLISPKRQKKEKRTSIGDNIEMDDQIKVYTRETVDNQSALVQNIDSPKEGEIKKSPDDVKTYEEDRNFTKAVENIDNTISYQKKNEQIKDLETFTTLDKQQTPDLGEKNETSDSTSKEGMNRKESGYFMDRVLRSSTTDKERSGEKISKDDKIKIGKKIAEENALRSSTTADGEKGRFDEDEENADSDGKIVINKELLDVDMISEKTLQYTNLTEGENVSKEVTNKSANTEDHKGMKVQEIVGCFDSGEQISGRFSVTRNKRIESKHLPVLSGNSLSSPDLQKLEQEESKRGLANIIPTSSVESDSKILREKPLLLEKSCENVKVDSSEELKTCELGEAGKKTDDGKKLLIVTENMGEVKVGSSKITTGIRDNNDVEQEKMCFSTKDVERAEVSSNERTAEVLEERIVEVVEERTVDVEKTTLKSCVEIFDEGNSSIASNKIMSMVDKNCLESTKKKATKKPSSKLKGKTDEDKKDKSTKGKIRSSGFHVEDEVTSPKHDIQQQKPQKRNKKKQSSEPAAGSDVIEEKLDVRIVESVTGDIQKTCSELQVEIDVDETTKAKKERKFVLSEDKNVAEETEKEMATGTVKSPQHQKSAGKTKSLQEKDASLDKVKSPENEVTLEINIEVAQSEKDEGAGCKSSEANVDEGILTKSNVKGNQHNLRKSRKDCPKQENAVDSKRKAKIESDCKNAGRRKAKVDEASKSSSSKTEGCTENVTKLGYEKDKSTSPKIESEPRVNLETTCDAESLKRNDEGRKRTSRSSSKRSRKDVLDSDQKRSSSSKTVLKEDREASAQSIEIKNNADSSIVTNLKAVRDQSINQSKSRSKSRDVLRSIDLDPSVIEKEAILVDKKGAHITKTFSNESTESHLNDDKFSKLGGKKGEELSTHLDSPMQDSSAEPVKKSSRSKSASAKKARRDASASEFESKIIKTKEKKTSRSKEATRGSSSKSIDPSTDVKETPVSTPVELTKPEKTMSEITVVVETKSKTEVNKKELKRRSSSKSKNISTPDVPEAEVITRNKPEKRESKLKISEKPRRSSSRNENPVATECEEKQTAISPKSEEKQTAISPKSEEKQTAISPKSEEPSIVGKVNKDRRRGSSRTKDRNALEKGGIHRRNSSRSEDASTLEIDEKLPRSSSRSKDVSTFENEEQLGRSSSRSKKVPTLVKEEQHRKSSQRSEDDALEKDDNHRSKNLPVLEKETGMKSAKILDKEPRKSSSRSKESRKEKKKSKSSIQYTKEIDTKTKSSEVEKDIVTIDDPKRSSLRSMDSSEKQSKRRASSSRSKIELPEGAVVLETSTTGENQKDSKETSGISDAGKQSMETSKVTEASVGVRKRTRSQCVDNSFPKEEIILKNVRSKSKTEKLDNKNYDADDNKSSFKEIEDESASLVGDKKCNSKKLSRNIAASLDEKHKSDNVIPTKVKIKEAESNICVKQTRKTKKQKKDVETLGQTKVKEKKDSFEEENNFRKCSDEPVLEKKENEEASLGGIVDTNGENVKLVQNIDVVKEINKRAGSSDPDEKEKLVQNIVKVDITYKRTASSDLDEKEGLVRSIEKSEETSKRTSSPEESEKEGGIFNLRKIQDAIKVIADSDDEQNVQARKKRRTSAPTKQNKEEFKKCLSKKKTKSGDSSLGIKEDELQKEKVETNDMDLKPVGLDWEESRDVRNVESSNTSKSKNCGDLEDLETSTLEASNELKYMQSSSKDDCSAGAQNELIEETNKNELKHTQSLYKHDFPASAVNELVEESNEIKIVNTETPVASESALESSKYNKRKREGRVSKTAKRKIVDGSSEIQRIPNEVNTAKSFVGASNEEKLALSPSRVSNENNCVDVQMGDIEASAISENVSSSTIVEPVEKSCAGLTITEEFAAKQNIILNKIDKTLEEKVWVFVKDGLKNSLIGKKLKIVKPVKMVNEVKTDQKRDSENIASASALNKSNATEVPLKMQTLGSSDRIQKILNTETLPVIQTNKTSNTLSEVQMNFNALKTDTFNSSSTCEDEINSIRLVKEDQMDSMFKEHQMDLIVKEHQMDSMVIKSSDRTVEEGEIAVKTKPDVIRKVKILQNQIVNRSPVNAKESTSSGESGALIRNPTKEMIQRKEKTKHIEELIDSLQENNKIKMDVPRVKYSIINEMKLMKKSKAQEAIKMITDDFNEEPEPGATVAKGIADAERTNLIIGEGSQQPNVAQPAIVQEQQAAIIVQEQHPAIVQPAIVLQQQQPTIVQPAIVEQPNVIVEHIPQFFEEVYNQIDPRQHVIFPSSEKIIPKVNLIEDKVHQHVVFPSPEKIIPKVDFLEDKVLISDGGIIIPIPVTLEDVLSSGQLNVINTIIDAQTATTTVGICGVRGLVSGGKMETEAPPLDVDERTLSEKVREQGSYEVKNATSDNSTPGGPSLSELSINKEHNKLDSSRERLEDDSPVDETNIFNFTEQVCGEPLDNSGEFQFAEQDGHLGFFIENDLTQDACLIDPDAGENMFIPSICKEEKVDHEEEVVNYYSTPTDHQVSMNDSDKSIREEFTQSPMSIETMNMYFNNSLSAADTAEERRGNCEYTSRTLIDVQSKPEGHTFPWANLGQAEVMNYDEKLASVTLPQEAVLRSKEPFNSETINKMFLNKTDDEQSKHADLTTQKKKHKKIGDINLVNIQKLKSDHKEPSKKCYYQAPGFAMERTPVFTSGYSQKESEAMQGRRETSIPVQSVQNRVESSQDVSGYQRRNSEREARVSRRNDRKRSILQFDLEIDRNELAKKSKPVASSDGKEEEDLFDTVKKLDPNTLPLINSTSAPGNTRDPTTVHDRFTSYHTSVRKPPPYEPLPYHSRETLYKKPKPNIIDPEELSKSFEREIKKKPVDKRLSALSEQDQYHRSRPSRHNSPEMYVHKKPPSHTMTSEKYEAIVGSSGSGSSSRGQMSNRRNSSHPYRRDVESEHGVSTRSQYSRIPGYAEPGMQVEGRQRHYSDYGENPGSRGHGSVSAYGSSSHGRHSGYASSVNTGRTRERNKRESSAYSDPYYSRKDLKFPLSNFRIGNPRNQRNDTSYLPLRWQEEEEDTAYLQPVDKMLSKPKVTFVHDNRN